MRSLKNRDMVLSQTQSEDPTGFLLFRPGIILEAREIEAHQWLIQHVVLVQGLPEGRNT